MWTYSQTSGKFYNPQGKCISTGYAGGNCGKNKEGLNNPDMQDQAKIGPLPEGLYKRGKLVPQSHLGKDAIELVPDPNNEMFGRSDFFLHGDTVPSGNASEGCIIQPHDARMEFNTSDDDQIQVVRSMDAS
jgi:hypothetical protein